MATALEESTERRLFIDDRVCPECGSTKLIRDYERAEIICGKCGLVLDDHLMDPGPEWREFPGDEKSRSRVGAPTSYRHHQNLTTIIDKSGKDINGKRLPPNTATRMRRLQKWNTRTRISNSLERNLSYANANLDRIGGLLGIPVNIRKAASRTYREFVEKGHLKGKSIDASTAAALYIECRRFGFPRSIEDLARVSNRRKKEICRTYRQVSRKLGIRLSPPNPTEYVPQYASRLGLPEDIGQKAIDILRVMFDNGLVNGRNPYGTAAAAVYVAAVQGDVKRTQKEVADVARVTEVTIRNRLREIYECIGLDEDDLDVNRRF